MVSISNWSCECLWCLYYCYFPCLYYSENWWKCLFLCLIKSGHCPSADNPRTSIVETDCFNKNVTGSNELGQEGNLCHIDCAQMGICDYKTGTCSCFEGQYGQDCSNQVQESGKLYAADGTSTNVQDISADSSSSLPTVVHLVNLVIGIQVVVEVSLKQCNNCVTIKNISLFWISLSTMIQKKKNFREPLPYALCGEPGTSRTQKGWRAFCTATWLFANPTVWTSKWSPQQQRTWHERSCWVNWLQAEGCPCEFFIFQRNVALISISFPDFLFVISNSKHALITLSERIKNKCRRIQQSALLTMQRKITIFVSWWMLRAILRG